ncbi:MAG: class I SAM-dependent methyltransferase [Actinomycetota bacterium]|nr:class I SAM-dependent methyltransferase [Actinomycetota bacterium]
MTTTPSTTRRSDTTSIDPEITHGGRGHAPATTFDNGARGRFNAWFFTAFDRYINVISSGHKQRAFAGIEPGTILELGAGVGANFAYLPTGSTVLALEPNEAMHRRLEERARGRDIDLELIEARAEVIPLPDESVDEVICSLVLCTVERPDLVLAEVLRVLRPGGAFRFVEHVAAHRGSPRGWAQRLLSRPWSWTFEGCQLGRHTDELIDAAGFGRTEIERRRLRRSIFFPVNEAISGTATKEHLGGHV